MSTMDLNRKGITWVGNFFQKLEAVCQEVDDIVSKDTVKYVENQLQNMGGNVKKFYSDVVQDALVDSVKREAQAVALKSNAAIGTYLKSMMGDEKKQEVTVIMQSNVQPEAVDPVTKQLPDALNGSHLKSQTPPTSVDSLEEAVTDKTLQKDDDVPTSENPNESTEESAIEESAPEVLELILPVVNGEKIIQEMRPLSACSSLLAESFSLSGKSPDNSLGALSCNYSGDCVCDYSSKLPSSPPAPIISCKNKSVESGLGSSSSILSLESIEEDTSRIKEILSLNESSESALGHSYDLNNDINDPDMETIELCDKVKLDESCVIVEPSELYAVSHRVRKLRSYRKKIQDAFASKKRLVKEYEQLAIWYGDVDMGSSKDGSQPLLTATPAKSLDSKNLQLELSYDTEWELL
ncbi:hypothetical protein RGQ29_027485 [Quercus rubra]|uniref:Uncharacterized protein n=1 Tax=Quercus rubra TaxID=3512 RepID=A0AAN7EPB3_QUERU|nr:hypothetical protein RGQ29_027485 [Quercus rubra]KAK4576986.1 hypothetical protein RGQ29_027485 [Quercus rubra]KAK4576987.1 hypothetical protein RGQ29_027485 [Quercus rubra]KAK4576988.1 hypothetical protein RGQ29_027485 [Quercus rubra]